MNDYMGQSFNYGINMGPFNVGYSAPSAGNSKAYHSYSVGINIGLKSPEGYLGVYSNSSLSKPIISF